MGRQTAPAGGAPQRSSGRPEWNAISRDAEGGHVYILLRTDQNGWIKLTIDKEQLGWRSKENNRIIFNAGF
jgi:hypothetical protein